MSDYKDYMTDAERLLDKLGYRYTGLDEFEGNPVYRKTTCDEFEDIKFDRTRKDQEIQLGVILVFMTIIIFLCLFIILIPIMIDQVEDFSKKFWAARIAWREGKEKYMKYIESHK